MKTLLLFIGLSFSICCGTRAQQDIHYNHIFSVANYYNPSFAGLYGGTSFSYNFTDCDFEHKNPGVYSSYFSFDTYLDSIRSAVGFTGYYNAIIPHQGSSAYIGAIYSPKFRLSEKYNLSPSIKPGFIRNREDIIIADDQLMPDTVAAKNNSFDLAAGILLNSKRFYIGFSVDHLLEPKINYLDNSLVPLKRKYIAQLGYHYAKSDTKASFIHFNLLYQNQDETYSLFASNYYVGRKTRYSFMGEEFFHRILLGAGFKLTGNPLSENGIFLGLGTQEKYLTLGVGFEVSTKDYHLSSIETSIKIAFDKE